MERVRNEVTCSPLSPSRPYLQLLIRQAEHLVVLVHLLILDPHMDIAGQEVSVAIRRRERLPADHRRRKAVVSYV